MLPDYTTSLGSFWNADYLDVIDIIPDASVDMVLIDPPFGCTELEWDVRPCLNTMWNHIKRVAKPNAAILIFGDMRFIIDVIAANRKDFRYDLVYEKTNAVGMFNASVMPMRAHEIIAVFYGIKPKYHKYVFEKGVPYASNRVNKRPDYYGKRDGSYSHVTCSTASLDGERCNRSVIKIKKNNKSIHPTEKPQELIQGLVRMYTAEGDTVVDFFAGSGSVGYACETLQRKWICVEREKEYFDKATARIQREVLDAPTLPLIIAPEARAESPPVALALDAALPL
jgi:site-specific DNA-methyltransferase (adenine-specific)